MELIWEKLSKIERILILIILMLVVVIVWVVKRDLNESTDTQVGFDESLTMQSEIHEQDVEEDKEVEVIMVDVKGAVKKPGVYQMDVGKRVNDAIAIAGGFLDNADPDQVNLAQTIQDEMVIYVPVVGEERITVSTVSQDEDKVNINNADSTELETIPGIGPSKSKAIIAYRDENGRFDVINDLTNVPGIGEKTLEQIKEYISVSN
jgi:competence protein ComEA